ncbi:acidic mammalian chitinase-like [Betta splendens]|uniref:Acidic mammalian chitinase-like n=1 Tax=Betta splendens TaxID=158456 RepID=A0A9W2XW96_BETSP|nr:acidic mammalian chitinase-like [Betta splendens]
MLCELLSCANMSRLILTAGLCLMIISLASSSMLVCYFDRSAETRAAQGEFTISDIDPKLCTHIIYTSADISSTNELVPFNASDLIDYKSLNRLKTRNPQLKTLLSVGGVTFNIQKFSKMASTPTTRSTFIQSAVLQLRTFGFDGINVDWRFPGPGDKQAFTMLCEELLGAFEDEGIQTYRQRLILTASVSAEKAVISASYEVPQIATSLDYLLVLTFDFHGPWENVTGHHSPLYQGSQDTGNNIYLNTDYAMRFWQDQGAPAQKLIMGLAAYGRAFTLASSATGVGAPANGPGEEGCYTGENGFWAYYETCLYIQRGQIEWIAKQEVFFSVTEDQWVGFDTQSSLAIKVSYIKANNFGGAFVWSLDLDDFRGEFCNQGINPFIRFLSSELILGAQKVPEIMAWELSRYFKPTSTWQQI